MKQSRTYRHTHSRRGVALMITLAVTLFLLVLLGAFLIVNKSNSSLSISGQKRSRAYNACLSGLHFLWGELEIHPTLGAGALPNGVTASYPEDEPLMSISYHGEEPDAGEIPDIETNYIEGTINSNGDSFVIRYINNLENRSAAEETQMGTVPARCAKIEVVGLSGGVQLKLETVLRKKPFVDYSMLSSQDMSLDIDPNEDSDAWIIGSDDPYINQIRSNAEIQGPSALNGNMRFEGPPRGGVAKATEDILLDGRSVQSGQGFWTQSQLEADGTFQVGTSSIDVPGLERDDLNLPSGTSTLSGEITLRPVIKHASYPDPNDSSRFILTKTQYQGVEYDNQMWLGSSGFAYPPVSSDQPGPNGFLPLTGGSPLPPQIHQNQDYPILHEENGSKVQVDLTTGDIAFSRGTQFEVQGDFRVRRELGALTPKVLMGYDIVEGGLPESTINAVDPEVVADNPDIYATAIVASQSIEIEGPVDGFGTLFAERAVTLQAKPTLSADPVLAVALHGETVNFSVAEENPSDKRLRRVLDTDWEVFQKAIDVNPDDNELGFGSYTEWHLANEPDDIDRQHRVIGDDPSDPGNTAKLRYRGSGLTGQQAWEGLRQDMGLSTSDEPNFDAYPFDTAWGGGNTELTLEQYVGLREYLRKDTADRNNWITLGGGGGMQSSGFEKVMFQIRRQIEFYSGWAEHMNKDMDSFMAQEELRISDVFFVGLVHAGAGGFHAEAGDYSLYFEGALVSQGKIEITETPWAKFVYNRDYLDDVIKHNFEDPVPLDQVYFKLN